MNFIQHNLSKMRKEKQLKRKKKGNKNIIDNMLKINCNKPNKQQENGK